MNQVSTRKALMFLRKGWDESTRTRDEHGRFAGGGAGRRPAIAAPKAKPTRNWTDKVAPGVLGREGQAGEYNPKTGQSTVETWHGHFMPGKEGDAHPDRGGIATPDRHNGVHAPIIANALNVPAPPPGKKPVAILTMGGPGSGKSSVLRNIDQSGFVKVDPDAIKEKLPEWKAMTNPANSYRGAAAAAHEESSYLAKQIRDQAIAEGKNVVIDGTGNKSDKMVDLINRLKENGYETHVHFAHVPTQTGVDRAMSRSEGSGRYVPPQFIEGAYKSIPGNFGKIAAAADRAYLHDNGGDKARQVMSKEPGKGWTEHDPEFVKGFRDKHGGV